MHYCNKNSQKHPTQKPEALYERMILASSDEEDTILDPFLGSGTLLRVCQQTGRNGIGIDNNPEYIKMTNERLSAPFTGFDSIDERMKSGGDDQFLCRCGLSRAFCNGSRIPLIDLGGNGIQPSSFLLFFSCYMRADVIKYLPVAYRCTLRRYSIVLEYAGGCRGVQMTVGYSGDLTGVI